MTPTLLTQARRAARRRRAEPTDWYTIGLGVLVIAGFPVQVLVGVAQRSTGSERAPLSPAPFTIGLAVVTALVALTAAMAVGPLRMSRAEYTTVLSAPLDRRSELARRWVNGLATGVSVGAVTGVVGAVVGGAGPGHLTSVGVVGAALGAAVVGTATGLQGEPEMTRRRVRLGASALAFAALLGATLLTSAERTWVPGPFLSAVAVVAAVVAAVVTVRWGWATVTGLDRAALTAGNALATAAGAAVLFLDPALLGGVLAQRELAASQVARSHSFPRGRLRALLTADVVRGTRNRRAVAVFVAALLLPYAAATVLPGRWVPVVVLVAAVTAVSPFAAGLRQICDSPVLRRMLGGRDAGLRAVHLVVPAVLAIAFALASAPAAPGRVLVTVLIVPIGVAANLWLRATGRPVEIGPRVVDVGLGPVPVDVIAFLVRGLGPLAVVAVLLINL